MTLLLNQYVCDHCDGVVEFNAPYRGFVVWPNHKTQLDNAYVFPTVQAAKAWVDSVNRKGVEIREVRIAKEPQWQTSQGTSSGFSLAKILYKVFPDHRFAPGDNCAYLV